MTAALRIFPSVIGAVITRRNSSSPQGRAAVPPVAARPAGEHTAPDRTDHDRDLDAIADAEDARDHAWAARDRRDDHTPAADLDLYRFRYVETDVPAGLTLDAWRRNTNGCRTRAA